MPPIFVNTKNVIKSHASLNGLISDISTLLWGIMLYKWGIIYVGATRLRRGR